MFSIRNDLKQRGEFLWRQRREVGRSPRAKQASVAAQRRNRHGENRPLRNRLRRNRVAESRRLERQQKRNQRRERNRLQRRNLQRGRSLLRERNLLPVRNQPQENHRPKKQVGRKQKLRQSVARRSADVLGLSRGRLHLRRRRRPNRRWLRWSLPRSHHRRVLATLSKKEPPPLGVAIFLTRDSLIIGCFLLAQFSL